MTDGTSGRRRRLTLAIAALAALVILVSAGALRRHRPDDSLTARVRRGTLLVRLTEAGVLKPAQSITYRSPIEGRELEITALAPEGTRVNEGDLVARLDTTQLQAELDRAVDDERQAAVARQVADAEWQDARAAVESLSDGEGALGVEEARSEMRLADRKLERLKAEYASLKPLLEQGYITREELERAAFELEQAEAAADLTRRKTSVLVARTYPRDRQKASLQLAERDAQRHNAALKMSEAHGRVAALKAAIEACSLYATHPGLVVYEDYLASSPRRKVRRGDRVTASQGLVTIPDLSRMLVESSVREKDLHQVRAGQKVLVTLDAFPSLHLEGRLKTIGTLARASVERPFDEKRFDATVELDTVSPELRPEMTARLDILVAERRSAILVPISAVFERQGGLVAYVSRAWKWEGRRLKVGASSDESVEVLEGLREGEVVSLVDASPDDSGRQPEAPAATPAKGVAGKEP